MSFNLLEERWIPARTASGAFRWIAPHEIVDPTDPIVRIASPRPDLDAAALQVLIGLIQACLAPPNERAWRQTWSTPPTMDVLERRLSVVSPAMELHGKGPRFFQDLELEFDPADATPVADLLADRPSDHALFANLEPNACLSLPMTALAVAASQINGPAGGRGHRAGLRGGGPLTTLVRGRTIWETVWLAVLPAEGERGKPWELGDVFPWLRPTRTSEAGQGVLPGEVHWLQVYFATQSRRRLGPITEGMCALTGAVGPSIASFTARNYGANYMGAWRHPLSPYYVAKPTEPPLPVHASPAGLTYRDWPRWVLGEDALRHPAEVVRVCIERSRDLPARRLWVFGFDFDQAKARCWYEGETPLIAVEEHQQAALRGRANGLAAAADEVRRTLGEQVKRALFREKDPAAAVPPAVPRQFWARTEAPFFAAVQALADGLGDPAAVAAVGEAWLVTLHQAARAIFQEHSQERGEFAATDIRRVSAAWLALLRFTRPEARPLRTILDLPLRERA